MDEIINIQMTGVDKFACTRKKIEGSKQNTNEIKNKLNILVQYHKLCSIRPNSQKYPPSYLLPSRDRIIFNLEKLILIARSNSLLVVDNNK